MAFVAPSPISRFHSDDAASGLVEFAISLTVLLMVIFGIMDMSRALYADHYVSEVSREATRYAMVRGSSWNNASCTNTSTFSCTATAANVTSFVQSITPMGLSPSNLTVNTTWPGTTASGADCSAANVNNSPGCVVTVKVTYAYNFVLPFLPRNALSLTSTSSVVISQ